MHFFFIPAYVRPETKLQEEVSSLSLFFGREKFTPHRLGTEYRRAEIKKVHAGQVVWIYGNTHLTANPTNLLLLLVLGLRKVP